MTSIVREPRQAAGSGSDWSTADYRGIFDAVSDALVICEAGSGSIIDINQKMCDLFGYSRKEALQLSFNDLFAGGPACTLAKAQGLIGEASQGEAQGVERQAKTRTGRCFWAEVHLQSLTMGGQPRVLAVIRDISGRKWAQKELQESEARYRLVSAHSLAGIFIIQDRVFRYVNRRLAQIFGYRPEEIVDRLGPLDLTDPEDRPLAAQHLKRYFEGEEVPAPQTFRGRTKTGQLIILAVMANLTDYQGKTAIIGTLVDITERWRTEEELHRRDAALEAMAFAATSLLQVSCWEDSIEAILARLGKAMGVSRVFLFEQQTAGESAPVISELYSWVPPGGNFQGRQEAWSTIPLSQTGKESIFGALSHGVVVDSLSWEISETERQALGLQELHSFAMAPIFIGQYWWGFIGIGDADASRLWSSAEREGLRTLGNTLAAAIQRQQAERALRQSERRFRSLVESMRDGLGVLDKEGRIAYVNEATCQLLGYPPEEMLGRPITDFTDTANRRVLQTRMARRRKGDHTSYEIDWLHKSGQKVSTIISPQPVYDENGEFQGSFAVVTDISGRKEIETRLVEMNRTLRAIVAASPQGIMALDPQGRVQMWSPASQAIFGWTEAEVLGRVNPLVPPDKEAEFQDSLRRTLAGESIAGWEVRRQRKDGSLVDISLSVAPLRDADGRVWGALGMTADISERKRAEEALRRRDAILEAVGFSGEKLLSSVSWEEHIRTILGRLGQAAAASRVFIFEQHFNQAGLSLISQRFEWTAPGISPTAGIVETENLDWRAAGFSHFEETLRRGDIICGNLADFPLPIQERWLRQDIKSILIVPIFAGHDLWGVVGFDDCLTARVWSTAEIEALRTAASILGAAIHRQHTEEALKTTEASYLTIFNAVNDAIALVDLDTGRFLEVNQKWCEMSGFSAEEARNMDLGRMCQEQPPYSVQDAVRWVRKAVTEGPQLFEWQSYNRAGKLHWTELNLKRTPIGGVDRILAVIRDITERKRTEEALVESRHQLRLLASQLLTIQEKERRRISRELHDELGQALTVLKFQLVGLQGNLWKNQQSLRNDCEHLLSLVDELIENVRRLSWDLSPSILEDLGLTSSLRHLIEEICKTNHMTSFVKLDDIDQLFPPEVQMNIYRIFQESLTNVARHAQATEITVAMKKAAGRVTFTIDDNGRGFDPQEALALNVSAKRLGLTAMDERARMVGGTLRLASRKGRGTKITVTIPIVNQGQEYVSPHLG